MCDDGIYWPGEALRHAENVKAVHYQGPYLLHALKTVPMTKMCITCSSWIPQTKEEQCLKCQKERPSRGRSRSNWGNVKEESKS